MNVVLKKYGWFLLKLLVFGLTVFYLFRAIHNSGHAVSDWQQILQGPKNKHTIWLVSIAVVLIPVNWGLEAVKWWLLSGKIQKIPYWKAYRAVMVGLTLGFITPNRLGDYAGRVLDLNSPRRLDALGAIFLGRFAQLVITVVAGSAGCFYFVWVFFWKAYPFAKVSFGIFLLAVNFVLLLLYYNPNLFISFVRVFRPLRRFVHYIEVLGQYTFKELSQTVLLAAARYVVFCFQFGLLLKAFGIDLRFLQYASGISGTFLLKSLMPSLSAFTDIGMREISAMHFFSLFGEDPLHVISASLSLWFLNIVFPSAVGLLFVFRLKLKKNNPV